MNSSLDLVVLVLVVLAAIAIDTFGPEASAKATEDAPKRSLRSYGIAAAVAIGVLFQFSSTVGLLRMVSLN